MSRLSRQHGFSLVTAIFLLAVLAVLMVNIVDLGVGQQTTVVMAVQGARALQAARSGLEVGVATVKALNGAACAANLPAISFSGDPVLSGYSVNIECASSVHTEGPVSSPIFFTVYQITATAESGLYDSGANANPDYVSRRLRVTVWYDQP
jgi:MSHA biogenesis protein MshP